MIDETYRPFVKRWQERGKGITSLLILTQNVLDSLRTGRRLVVSCELLERMRMRIVSFLVVHARRRKFHLKLHFQSRFKHNRAFSSCLKRSFHCLPNFPTVKQTMDRRIDKDVRVVSLERGP